MPAHTRCIHRADSHADNQDTTGNSAESKHGRNLSNLFNPTKPLLLVGKLLTNFGHIVTLGLDIRQKLNKTFPK